MESMSVIFFFCSHFLLNNAPLQQLLLATGDDGLYYRDAWTGCRVGHVSAKLIILHFLLSLILLGLLFRQTAHSPLLHEVPK